MSSFSKFSTLMALLLLTVSIQAENKNQQAHSHNHVHTPHMGITAPFHSGESHVGFVELKLHDDKGDLELWFTKDEAGSKPYDLTLNTPIKVTFLNIEQKTVELRVRNNKNNEDEQGQGTIRGDKTNYFIFPGDTGSDASFLIGKSFVAKVAITFTVNEVTYTTKPFELKPHTH
jgi:hypothetical protein